MTGPTRKSDRLIAKAIADLQAIGLHDESGWCAGYLASSPNRRLATDLDIIRREVPAGATMCEYGAAPFILTTALHREKYEVVGVDLAPHRFRPLLKIEPIIVGVDAETGSMPFAISTFDAIIFNELFEHLRLDLVQTMQEVYRITKPGGVLILSTPNLRSIRGIANFLLHNRAYSCANDLFFEWNKLSRIGHMGHVREYTEREVVDFLGKVGFEVKRVIYREGFGLVTMKRRLAKLMTFFLPKLKPNMTLVFKK
jgi:SAM-dependent methyltransferase